MTLNLKSLQTLVYRAITAEPGAAAGLDDGILVHVIGSDERVLSARERIGIYADAYFYRLLDCLREDFPDTAAVIGGPAFQDFVRAYLRQHPPTEPSIFYAGRHLADFLADHLLRERWPFLAELALERTLIEVFHDTDAPALSASEIGTIAPAEWRTLSLCTHPALRMLNCNWRVNDVLRAVESGTEWREPAHTPVALVVWRQGTQVYYRELELPERVALEAASEGADFAIVCEAFASRFDGEDPAATIKEMVTRWGVDGLLTRT